MCSSRDTFLPWFIYGNGISSGYEAGIYKINFFSSLAVGNQWGNLCVWIGTCNSNRLEFKHINIILAWFDLLCFCFLCIYMGKSEEGFLIRNWLDSVGNKKVGSAMVMT